jgi:hypothetical protein
VECCDRSGIRCRADNSRYRLPTYRRVVRQRLDSIGNAKTVLRINAMNIYATLWSVQFPRYRDYYVGCELKGLPRTLVHQLGVWLRGWRPIRRIPASRSGSERRKNLGPTSLPVEVGDPAALGAEGALENYASLIGFVSLGQGKGASVFRAPLAPELSIRTRRRVVASAASLFSSPASRR